LTGAGHGRRRDGTGTSAAWGSPTAASRLKRVMEERYFPAMSEKRTLLRLAQSSALAVFVHEPGVPVNGARTRGLIPQCRTYNQSKATKGTRGRTRRCHKPAHRSHGTVFSGSLRAPAAHWLAVDRSAGSAALNPSRAMRRTISARIGRGVAKFSVKRTSAGRTPARVGQHDRHSEKNSAGSRRAGVRVAGEMDERPVAETGPGSKARPVTCLGWMVATRGRC